MTTFMSLIMRIIFFIVLLVPALATKTQLWSETTLISKDSKIPGKPILGWKCNHCSLESWNRNACRLQFHLASLISLQNKDKGFFGINLCSQVPEDVKAKAKEEIETKSSDSVSKGKRKAESDTTDDAEAHERATRMKGSIPSLDNKPQAKILADNSVSDFFDGTATPYALVDHSLFSRMITNIVAAGAGYIFYFLFDCSYYYLFIHILS